MPPQPFDSTTLEAWFDALLASPAQVITPGAILAICLLVGTVGLLALVVASMTEEPGTVKPGQGRAAGNWFGDACPWACRWLPSRPFSTHR